MKKIALSLDCIETYFANYYTGASKSLRFALEIKALEAMLYQILN